MGLRKEISKTFESLGFVFSNWKYKLHAGFFSILIFVFLYYFLVVKVADKSIWISVMMSGAFFVTISILFVLITAFLSGILFSMILFQFNNFRKQTKKGFFGFVGSGIAAFGVGCPTCGAFLFGLIGLPLALTYFPFGGLEFQFFGILILIFSIHFTGKSLYGKCELNKGNSGLQKKYKSSLNITFKEVSE